MINILFIKATLFIQTEISGLNSLTLVIFCFIVYEIFLQPLDGFPFGTFGADTPLPASMSSANIKSKCQCVQYFQPITSSAATVFSVAKHYRQHGTHYTVPTIVSYTCDHI